MLEWLAVTTGVELGKLVLEQVLDLGKPVLEGYVQDFFKDCLSSGVSRLNATALKTLMAEAVGYFIKRFIKELQINDQQQLHQHLLESPTLVMFDGLDEVFDRTTQSIIIDDIIRFSQQYPKAQVLITSRIIGYNPDRLQHSGFRHFTIQSLDTDEIHEFIDRWYDLSMGSDPDKVRLKQRLKDAIANSKAIANLADNPLLLTMMAILNRRQELPRDRALNDPDEQLREWAQEQLEKWENISELDISR